MLFVPTLTVGHISNKCTKCSLRYYRPLTTFLGKRFPSIKSFRFDGLRMTVDDKQLVTNYFNTVGFERWRKIYSDNEQVNRVQQDIRRGHQQTVDTILRWIEEDGDVTQQSFCDAGCGVGSLSIPLAKLGAREVVASDISHAMVKEAQERAKKEWGGSIPSCLTFNVGDLQHLQGSFHTVLCVDVLIHYSDDQLGSLLDSLCRVANNRMIISFAPKTFYYTLLKRIGDFFPGPSKATRAYLHREIERYPRRSPTTWLACDSKTFGEDAFLLFPYCFIEKGLNASPCVVDMSSEQPGATDTCVEEDITSKASGLRIHTYRWIPPSLADNPANTKASVFLIHGLHSNTLCEYLEPDPAHHMARRLYQDSIPELLNKHGFMVFAHDHQGHGKSQGKCKGYFDSMDTLVADAHQFIEWITEEKYPVLKEKPVFLIGCSMGSLVTILLGLKYGPLFRGAVLISPAVSQAKNQFGFIGRLLKPMSSFVSAWYPTLPVLRLPRNEKFPELQKSWDNDELNYHGKLRARVGEQFIKTYDELSVKSSNFHIPFIMYYGSEDTLVDPQGMQRFYDMASSSDKKVVALEGRWHILHHEPGKEFVREQFLQWIQERCKDS